MHKRLGLKVFCFVVVFLGLWTAMNSGAWAAATKAGQSVNLTVKEVEFKSEAAMEAWLTKYAKQNPEYSDEVLSAIDDLPGSLADASDEAPAACKNVTLTPASITVQTPIKFKLYQIIINLSIGDCGGILCSTLGFDVTWNIGPAAGATLIGPFPSQTHEQYCVGNSIASKAFLLLNKDIPKGSYSLKIKVGGFASADYWNLPMTVQ